MRLRRLVALTVGILVAAIVIAITGVALTAPRKDASGFAGDLEESLKSDQLRAVMLLVLVGGTAFIAGFGVRDGIGRLAQRASEKTRPFSPKEANRGK